MIALLLAVALAQPPRTIEQLYAAGRCDEVRARAAAAPHSPSAAYFLGACRLAAGDARGAESAFDEARRAPGWRTLATFMRGLARLQLADTDEAKADLRAALATSDLPADLAQTATELLAGDEGSTVHGAASASFDYDTNALLGPVDNIGGLVQTPSPAVLGTGVLLWNPAPDWQLRAILLHRQVAEAPQASVGAALLHLRRRFELGPWMASLAADGGGYLLGWGPFLASGGGSASVGWKGNSGARVALSACGRWQAFAGSYAGLTGPDVRLALEGSQRFAAFTLGGGLGHGAFWTRDPDFVRDEESAFVKLGWESGAFTARARLTGGFSPYAHVNSLEDVAGVRAPRQDLRLEPELALDYALGDHLSLAAGWTGTWNASNIAVYSYGRQLARLGLTCAF